MFPCRGTGGVPYFFLSVKIKKGRGNFHDPKDKKRIVGLRATHDPNGFFKVLYHGAGTPRKVNLPPPALIVFLIERFMSVVDWHPSSPKGPINTIIDSFVNPFLFSGM
jgi:hypothetical protein